MIFILLAQSSQLWAAREDYAIEEVQLVKTDTPVIASVVMEEPVRFLAKTANFLLSASRRKVWISKDGVRFEILDVFEKAPSDADWISKVCEAGDQVFISIASYPEERRLEELDSPSGGFRRGPEGRGMLFTRGSDVAYKKSLEITKLSQRLKKQIEMYPTENMSSPKYFDESIQSCFYDDNSLF